jgi:DNA-binding transcriptional LysR family regulator
VAQLFCTGSSVAPYRADPFLYRRAGIRTPDGGLYVRPERAASARKLLLGTSAYFAQAGLPTTPAELAGHAAVIYVQGGAGTWSLRQGASDVSITVSGPLRVSAEGVRAAVLADMGLAITSAWMLSPELGSRRAGGARGLVAAATRSKDGLSYRLHAQRQARTFATFVEAQLAKPYWNTAINIIVRGPR